jgi:hypothetical protein
MFQKNTIILSLKNNYLNIITGLIIIAAIFARISLYDNPRLSIAANDSVTYYSAASVPLLSWQTFTGRVVPSYPLFFKIFQPEDGYQKPTAISHPAAHGVGTRQKALQPGFDTVVLAQMILSIFAWVAFVVVLSRRITTKILRPLIALLVLVFAFSPAAAEWDALLMTESMSFSFFTLVSALALELIFRIREETTKPGRITIALMVIFLFAVFIWAFIRDSNASSINVSIIILLAVILIPGLRQRIPLKWVIAIAAFMIFIVGLYSYTTYYANRFIFSWGNIWNHWISISEPRVKFFLAHGMPDPWTKEWVVESGPKTYMLFLLNHPGFVVTEVMSRLSDAFSENVQPFYFIYPTLYRKMLLAVNDIFHPLSSAAFFFPLLGLILTAISTFSKKTQIETKLPWLIFVFWLVGMVYCQFFASFFGDSAGLIRHTLGAVLFMRMMVWLMPIILVEIAMQHKTESE